MLRQGILCAVDKRSPITCDKLSEFPPILARLLSPLPTRCLLCRAHNQPFISCGHGSASSPRTVEQHTHPRAFGSVAARSAEKSRESRWLSGAGEPTRVRRESKSAPLSSRRRLTRQRTSRLHRALLGSLSSLWRAQSTDRLTLLTACDPLPTFLPASALPDWRSLVTLDSASLAADVIGAGRSVAVR